MKRRGRQGTEVGTRGKSQRTGNVGKMEMTSGMRKKWETNGIMRNKMMLKNLMMKMFLIWKERLL
jgi:hypothetical protein